MITLVFIFSKQSNSSTESESIPFANDNAGTIKQQKTGSRAHQLVASNSVGSGESKLNEKIPLTSNVVDFGVICANYCVLPGSQSGTGDVLNDIGNMLADLTDELDAILEQEMNSKR